ncbi:uncharacterized protein LOC131996735 [Stomoxys calcitrans]|uniref:uncharacterized protein LOC131996735 n=1 Tax=Stomoxys calcitrans TaxID=35570 RepID=UPI0027E3A82B|nr:uncharacterized protein LOC131996735 [Stomoxys calcitrans]
MDEFRQTFISSNIDIICVSETWFHSDIADSIYELQGYKLFRSDRVTNAGGVCMYLRNELKCNLKLKSNNDNPMEYLFLELFCADNKKILVGTVYRPNRNVPFGYFTDAIEELTVFYSDVIISGDYNSNLLSESKFADAMNTFGLYSVNTTIPTHYSHTGNTLIDAIFVNCREKILLYDQLSAPSFSKHDLLFIKYDVNLKKNQTEYLIRDFRKLNYNLLNDLSNNIAWDAIYGYESVEDQVSFMQHHISLLYDYCVPLRIIKGIHKQQPWFTPEVKNLIQRRDTLYKRWKYYKTTILYNNFKEARRQVNEKIKVLKTEYYRQKFTTAVNSGSKWKVIRSIGIGKKNISTPDMNVEDLNQMFANHQNLTPNSSINNFSNNDFRPIAILPYLSKVLERVMHKQINNYICTNKLLTERQSGFRSQRSCITALTDVIENLRLNMDNNMLSILMMFNFIQVHI